MLVAMVCLASALRLAGQSFHADEIKKLKTFLRQKSAVAGKANYEQLGVADTNAINWAALPGLTWGDDGRLTAIKWDSKQLAGSLDLSGFTSLRELHCQRNALTELLLTGDTLLYYTDCYNNAFTALDITTNVNMEHFCCRYNRLTTLDLTHNPRLTFLCLSGNLFTHFDISHNPLLKEFYAAKCRLEEIDFSRNPHLQHISVRGNQLKRLDLSGHAELIQALCYDNELTELNVKGCRALQRLSAYDNRLSALDLTDCRALENLPLYNNAIAALDVSTCPQINFMSLMNNGMHTLKLPDKPKDKLEIMCAVNRFTYSTLPDAKYLRSYAPQAKVAVNMPTNKVDLSSEYQVGDSVSTFTWASGSMPITPTTAHDGHFTFPADMEGKTLTCTITNGAYPKLTLTYEVTFTASVASAVVPDASATISASAGSLKILTARPLTACIYTLTGSLVIQQRIGVGETNLPIAHGIYIVALSDGTVRKVFVE